MIATNQSVSVSEPESERSVIFADDYLSKITGEQIEYECKRRIADGCSELVVNFAKTEVINSIAISILLGVIDNAAKNGAKIIFSEVNEHTLELFEMLGLTRHVVIE